VKLSTTYKILKGDTLSLISKKIFGTEIHSNHILRSNPGLTEILTEGTSIVIPGLPSYSRDNLITGEGEDGIQIFIDKKPFKFWTEISITRAVDSFDIVNFTVPFEPDAAGFKETFKPFTYKKVTVSLGGKTLITGVILSNRPNLTASENMIEVSGYSLPAVLHDCMLPSSSYPLEFIGADLRTIAEAVTKPFGIKTIFKADAGAKFDTVAMRPSQTVFSFLSKLAEQRNLVMSSTSSGDLLFWQSVTEVTKPVAEFKEGSPGLISISAQFREREYYSHVTGIVPSTAGVSDSQKFTDKNPHLTGILRPYTFVPPDSDNANIKTAVNTKFGRMFANMCGYTLTIPSWYDKNGDIWKPNTTIQMQMPRVFIYNKYNFIIRSVELRKDTSSETAVLNTVLSGSFSGKAPKDLPWDF